MTARRAWVLLPIAAGLACAAPRAPRPDGTAWVSWTGADTGAFEAVPAALDWCAPRARARLLAFRRDTAVGLALFPVDSLVADRLEVTEPLPDSVPPRRPSARLALRVPGEAAIDGYRSAGGQVVLDTVTDTLVTGRLVAVRMVAQTRTEPIVVEGRFRARPRPATVACATADTGAGTSD